MAKSDIEWQRVVQWMTASGTMNGNEWQRVVQRVTKNDIERQRMKTSDKKSQWMTANNSKWYNERKRYRTLQKMDDSHKTQKQIHHFKRWMAAIRVVR